MELGSLSIIYDKNSPESLHRSSRFLSLVILDFFLRMAIVPLCMAIGSLSYKVI